MVIASDRAAAGALYGRSSLPKVRVSEITGTCTLLRSHFNTLNAMSKAWIRAEMGERPYQEGLGSRLRRAEDTSVDTDISFGAIEFCLFCLSRCKLNCGEAVRELMGLREGWGYYGEGGNLSSLR